MSDNTMTGTREWSEASANCYTGCSHGCRYCYALADAIRWGKASRESWPTMKLLEKQLNRKWPKMNGTVMFPTTHDITPETLDPCCQMIGNILKSGNDILIVSKPHLSCITEICRRFQADKERILFRFTIGARSDEILSYWDPNAPGYMERWHSLIEAFDRDYKTSISMEPLLDASDVEHAVDILSICVTDTIWIGCMNRIKGRVRIETEEDKRQVARIEAGQTPERIREIYEALKVNPKVRWKDSYRKVLEAQGVSLPEVQR